MFGYISKAIAYAFVGGIGFVGSVLAFNESVRAVNGAIALSNREGTPETLKVGGAPGSIAVNQ